MSSIRSTSRLPPARGKRLKAVGKDDGSVMIVSIDGGCPGVKNVEAGVIGATSQQYPLKMAAMALEAINTGKLPEIDPAVGFFDTGAQLITAKPVDGVSSIIRRGRPETLLGLSTFKSAAVAAIVMKVGGRRHTASLCNRRSGRSSG